MATTPDADRDDGAGRRRRPVVVDTTSPDGLCADCGEPAWSGELLAGLHRCGPVDTPTVSPAEALAEMRRRLRDAEPATPQPATVEPATYRRIVARTRLGVAEAAEAAAKHERLRLARWAAFIAEMGGRIGMRP